MNYIMYRRYIYLSYIVTILRIENVIVEIITNTYARVKHTQTRVKFIIKSYIRNNRVTNLKIFRRCHEETKLQSGRIYIPVES